MSLEQLIRELRTVPPDGLAEWRDLRAEWIGALSVDDRATLVASRLNQTIDEFEAEHGSIH